MTIGRTLAAHANPPALTTAEAGACIANVGAAERAGDRSAIGAALARDCRIEMRSVREGLAHDSAMSRDEFPVDLGEDYATLHELDGYAYRSEPARVTISADGRVARATGEVIESFAVDGKRHVFHIEEAARIERRDGALAISGLASRSRPD